MKDPTPRTNYETRQIPTGKMALGGLYLESLLEVDKTTTIKSCYILDDSKRDYAQSIVGLKIGDIFAEKTAEHISQAITESIESGSAATVEYSPGIMSYRYFSARIQQKDSTTAIVMISNIAKFRKSFMLDTGRMKSIGYLAGGIAHEFNNILCAISGNAEFLLYRLDNEGLCEKILREKLKTISQAGIRAENLVKQLVGFSQQGKYVPQNIDIDDCVRQQVKSLQKQFSDFPIVCSANSERSIYADVSQLHQVIQNLLINARDSSPEGEKISISTKYVEFTKPVICVYESIPAGNYVELAVADQGEAIAKEELEYIFYPFRTSTGGAEKNGLALATVYGIVRNHGGYVDVISIQGKGTTFHVYFPVLFAQSESAPEETKTQEAKKLLIVDDELPVRMLLEDFLVDQGYQVTTAEDGESAYELVKRENFDLILTDIIMEKMAGDELFEKICEYYAPNSPPPVYAMSGFAKDKRVEKMLRQGACGFLAKPFRLNQVDELIRGALREKEIDKIRNRGQS